jgi:hypothetical protein
MPTQMRSSPQNVRFSDFRVPTPAGKSTSDLNYMKATARCSTPSTVSTSGTWSPSPSLASRSSSPYGFIPIGTDDRFTPPVSPYDFQKTYPSSSTSAWSETTIDTVRFKASLRASPGFAALGAPPVFRPTPKGRESPRPRTPTGKKSPFQKSDDDLTRKTRIKTEMCLHFTNGRPCPFGANCTYAHGEEELQMTRLLDLDKAGLIDVETYRTKPCLTWIMTGSW